MAKKVILYVILIILNLSLTSCQTMQGVGGDIQWTAKKTAETWGEKKAETEEEEDAEGWGGEKARGKVEEDRY